jgi:formylglycine-generating enzyme required for sulfatase activity/proteasome lid subunit RPN8/RPN11
MLFETNTRNSSDWRDKFESYGRYFFEHEDAGFVSTPEESWRLQKQIWARGMVEVGLFHSHLRHPANFSQIDYDLHTQRFSHLWHLIVSVRNPDLPQLRVFDVSEAAVREQRTIPSPLDQWRPSANNLLDGPKTGDQAIAQAKRILALDSKGRPTCKDNRLIVATIGGLLRTENHEAANELLIRGFLAGSLERYEEYVAQTMRVCGGRFEMGTRLGCNRHFVGESPCHRVALSPFSIATVPVTNELFSVFDQQRLDVPASDDQKPAVDVSWYDATVFAMWMGCRLPTEAEWEFACAAGSSGEWACGDENLLSRLAWYSENSSGQIRPVGTREPNAFGLLDFHGNVWEWCHDSFDQDYYSCSATVDPVNISSTSNDKVCRGGSINALSEMCRTRYRFHEPAAFFAGDLGFRLAASDRSNGDETRLWLL